MTPLDDKTPMASRYAKVDALTGVPNRVSPAIEGYFRIPAVWVGEPPIPGSVRTLNPQVHHATAVQTKLSCGIEVRVQRDGLFLFDFSGWQLAKPTVVPGYVRVIGAELFELPKEHQEAEDRAEEIAVFRAQVMNVHQACLTTAERLVAHRAADMGFPITSWNTFKTLDLGSSPPYYDDPEDMHALAHNVLNCKYMQNDSVPIPRRSLELVVVERSLRYLDAILRRNEREIVELVEGAYISACRYRENRRGECIAIGWTVCEQLISIAYKGLLGNRFREKEPAQKITANRNPSASTMLTFLKKTYKISASLYEKLEVVRRARNGWVHNMSLPSRVQAFACQESIEELLERVQSLCIRLPYAVRGSVPLWVIGTAQVL